MEYIINFFINGLKNLSIYGFLIILCYVINKLISKYLFNSIKKIIVSKTKPKWFKYKIIKPLISKIFYIVPGIFLYFILYYYKSNHVDSIFIGVLNIIIINYLVFIILFLVNSLINLIENIYSNNHYAIKANISIKSIGQISKIICLAMALIASFGIITGSSLTNIFTGIAGLSALLAFLFQEIIKNFIAAMQIVFSGLLRVGDWIEIKEKKMSGIISQISFTMVQIQTMEGYIINLPTQTFISTGIVNLKNIVKPWNALLRINLYLQIKNIKFISEKDFHNLLNNDQFKQYLKGITFKENITNIEIFRLYLSLYLMNYLGICKTSSITVNIFEDNNEFVIIQIVASVEQSSIKSCKEIESRLSEHFISMMNKMLLM